MLTTYIPGGKQCSLTMNMIYSPTPNVSGRSLCSVEHKQIPSVQYCADFSIARYFHESHQFPAVQTVHALT
jgi:hypothetical protein